MRPGRAAATIALFLGVLGGLAAAYGTVTFERGPAFIPAISLAYGVLAGVLAAAAKAPWTRIARSVGWLAALPGIACVAVLVGHDAIVAAFGCENGALLAIRCPGTLTAQAAQTIIQWLYIVLFFWPASAGPVLFAFGFLVVMIVRGGRRIMRGRDSGA